MDNIFVFNGIRFWTVVFAGALLYWLSAASRARRKAVRLAAFIALQIIVLRWGFQIPDVTLLWAVAICALVYAAALSKSSLLKLGVAGLVLASLVFFKSHEIQYKYGYFIFAGRPGWPAL